MRDVAPAGPSISLGRRNSSLDRHRGVALGQFLPEACSGAAYLVYPIATALGASSRILGCHLRPSWRSVRGASGLRRVGRDHTCGFQEQPCLPDGRGLPTCSSRASPWRKGQALKRQRRRQAEARSRMSALGRKRTSAEGCKADIAPVLDARSLACVPDRRRYGCEAAWTVGLDTGVGKTGRLR